MIRVYLSGNDVHDLCLESMFKGCPFPKSIHTIEEYQPSEVAVIFGVFKKDIPISWPRGRVLEGQRDAGKPTVVIDSGYIHRGVSFDNYYMVGLDGLNGRANFKNNDVPGDRWEALAVALQPWRRTGRHVVLCGQVPWDASVQNIDIIEWCRLTVGRIKSVSSRPVVYRPHPLALEHSPPIDGAAYSTAPLADDLRDAWAVVTYNSNTAVEAAIDGYPVFAVDIGSMAYEIACHDVDRIEEPLCPDRETWTHRLAYSQWTPAEMSAGLPWRHLFPDGIPT